LKREFGGVDVAQDPKGPTATEYGGVVSTGDTDMVYSYYQKQMQLATDRLQKYRELELMDDDDVVSAALDIWAEDSSQPDPVNGKRLWVETDNENLQGIINETLDVIGLDDMILPTARELALYGDSMSGVLQERRADGMPGRIVGLAAIDPKSIHRVEDKYRRLIGWTRGILPINLTKDKAGTDMAAPWEYLHARLLGRGRDLSYGYAMIAPARRMFRKLRMMEDALVIYRMRRAPDRWIFKFKNLKGMSVEEKYRVVNMARTEMRKRMLVDPATGQVRSEMDPLSIDEDLYLDDDLIAVEKLAGNERIGHVMDIEYMRKRFYGCLKIPPDYLGFEEAKGASLTQQSPLSMQDIQFARSCKRIQKALMIFATRLIKVDLCWRGMDPELEQNQFVVKMAPVSYLDEMNRSKMLETQVAALNQLKDICGELDVEKSQWLSYARKMIGLAPELEKMVSAGPEVDLKGKMDIVDNYRSVLPSALVKNDGLLPVVDVGSGDVLNESVQKVLVDSLFMDGEDAEVFDHSTLEWKKDVDIVG